MTDRYAVIGHPVKHSLSPRIHAAFAHQTGEDLVYERLEAAPDAFVQAVDAFRQSGGAGLNVTLPFKEAACTYAQRLSQRAERAGAVNTLAFESDAVLGDNTDGLGLLKDLEENWQLDLGGRRILVLGAGGATRGILQPLLDRQPARLRVVNRTLERARNLRDDWPQAEALEAGDYQSLTGTAWDLVLNATSASLSAQRLPLPSGLFAPGALAYDLAYGTSDTAFMIQAGELGAERTADGLGMLVGQAAASFAIWRGVTPDVAPVVALLRREMAA